MKRMHIAEAQAQGFTVDNSAAGRPWAYKGPRFQPIAACECYTELESELMKLVPVLEALAHSVGHPASSSAYDALRKLDQDVVIAARAV